VSGMGFSSRQRVAIFLMIVLAVAALAMVSGFIVTSLQYSNPVSLTKTIVDVVGATPSNVPLSPSPVPTTSPEADSGSPTPPIGIWSQVQAARLFDQIAYQVESLRGLPPRTEVPLSFLSAGDMTLLWQRYHREHNTLEQLLAFHELNLLPAVPGRFRVHPAAGVYIVDQGQMFVEMNSQEDSLDDQSLLAYAYAHALQDQHFDLEAIDLRATTTDATLAGRALIEGDAMVLTALYRYGTFSQTDWEALTDLIVQAEEPEYDQALEEAIVWRRLKRFPYWEGRLFAQTLFESGGWEAVNMAYVIPPRSTTQILHPDQYLTVTMGTGTGPGPDFPIQVIVPDLGETLGDGWARQLHDTLGELSIGLYLSAQLPEEVAWQAAEGWNGDTMVIWGKGDGVRSGEGESVVGERLIVWRTIWDSIEEATEFEDALNAWVRQRYLPVRPLESAPQGLAGRWWEVNEGAVWLSRTARYVLWVVGPDVETIVRVGKVLP